MLLLVRKVSSQTIQMSISAETKSSFFLKKHQLYEFLNGSIALNTRNWNQSRKCGNSAYTYQSNIHKKFTRQLLIVSFIFISFKKLVQKWDFGGTHLEVSPISINMYHLQLTAESYKLILNVLILNWYAVNWICLYLLLVYFVWYL